MELKKIKEYVQTGWKWTNRAYLTAFLATSLHVGYDFYTSNLPRIERGETVQILEVHRYRVNVDGNGKEKYLTLVGENHDYNQTEHEIAQKLVNEHQHFADECGSDLFENISIGNFLYASAVAIPLIITDFYQNLGDGRWYDSIDAIAEERGYKVHALEKVDDPFNNMSAGGKARLFGESVFSALTAPLAYYEAKNETPYDASKYANFAYRESLIDSRDPVMAQGIVDLLKKDEIDKLLAEVGRIHLEGVISNLSKQIELREVK